VTHRLDERIAVRCRKGPSALAAGLALVLGLALAACEREDRAEVEESLERAGDEVDEAWREARPEIEEGARDVGDAVGKGVEAAGEVLQRGGEELQEDARDTAATTLPDTVRRDTMVLD
jgi:hypothetical protein